MNEPRYYYLHQNRRFGPMVFPDLRAAAAGGQLTPADLVWKEGQPAWVPGAQVDGLFPNAPETPAVLEAVVIGAASTPADDPGPAAARFYCAENRRRVGPLSFPDLKGRVAAGKLLPADMVWREGTPKWVEALTVPGLFPPAPAPGGEAVAPVIVGDVVMEPVLMAEVSLEAQVVTETGLQAGVVGRPRPSGGETPGWSFWGKPEGRAGDGLKADELIARQCGPGEDLLGRVAGDLFGSWPARKFVAALTSRRLLLVETEAHSFVDDAVKEWTAYPLNAVQVSCTTGLLTSSVTVTLPDSTKFTLNNLPQVAAKRFESQFNLLQEGHLI
jgi:hypothetical protein